MDFKYEGKAEVKAKDFFQSIQNGDDISQFFDLNTIKSVKFLVPVEITLNDNSKVVRYINLEEGSMVGNDPENFKKSVFDFLDNRIEDTEEFEE